MEKSIQELEELANNGDTRAIYELGKIYYNGTGVPTDHCKARDYFEKSASANNVFAKYYLGKLCYWGDCGEKDWDKATAYKESILKNPLYVSEKVGLEDFYSIADFEKNTKNFVTELHERVDYQYKNLYGKEKI